MIRRQNFVQFIGPAPSVVSHSFLSKSIKATADPSTHHPQTPHQRAKIALWGPRSTFGAPFAQDDNCICDANE